MLSIEEYKILSSCADDAELFYFLFASINYDGQDELGFISKDGIEIIKTIIKLIYLDLLDSWRVDDYGNRSRIDEINEKEYEVYLDYSCHSFDEHLDKYGYGPHEFEITDKGLEEIHRPDYEIYENQEVCKRVE